MMKRLIVWRKGSCMSKYYYHATYDLLSFIDILKDKGIKCLRLLGMTIEHDLDKLALNGLDYICLCNKLVNYEDIFGENSFEQFILDSFCFIVSNEINVIKPKVINWTDVYKYMAIKKEVNSDTNQNLQVSIYADEYRAKNIITMDMILGIGLPFEYKYTKEDLTLLRQSLVLAQSLGLDIVDSSDEYFIEKYESRKYNKDEIIQKIKGLGL